MVVIYIYIHMVNLLFPWQVCCSFSRYIFYSRQSLSTMFIYIYTSMAYCSEQCLIIRLVLLINFSSNYT